jgi:hypothetical protein
MNDKFEDIEHEQFGEDGFENAVKQISAIEKSLGLADISQFTAPPPPTAQLPKPRGVINRSVFPNCRVCIVIILYPS